jgi:predicted nucleic acid-binding protein
VRVFLDANVLFSAAWSRGAVWRLLDDLSGSVHTAVADAYVWGEAEKNLYVHRRAALGDLDKLKTKVEFHSRFAGAVSVVDSIVLPEKDRPVLASAIALDCDALVSGDRSHFGPLWGQRVSGVLMLSPRLLAEQTLRK